MKYQKIGPYVLLQRIASGGMADIFLAKKSGPNNLNSFYAIKKILVKYAEMPEFHKMFHEEAKVTNALSLDIHKNVMTSATYKKIGSHYVFVMEYIKGLNLKHFLNLAEKKEIPLSPEGILYIIAEIASGLDHLHNLVNLKTGQPLKLIHRDISPQNIMISHNGQIKIIDFGIAKASILEESQVDAGIKGKMAYMSPEQAVGNNLDHRSDIFSLGVMLWELLAKKRLFLADSSLKTLRNVKDCQIPDIKSFNPNLPEGVEQILRKCLAKNKNDRYEHASDFAQDLYKVTQGQNSFSSYNFEKLSKNIYTEDIIKNRRLLAKYMNTSMEESDSVMDITNVGVDIDKLDKEDTQDLSTQTNVQTEQPLVITSAHEPLVNRSTPAPSQKPVAPRVSQKPATPTPTPTYRKQKVTSHTKGDIDLKLNTMTQHNIQIKQKTLRKSTFEEKFTMANQSSKNTHTSQQRSRTFKKKNKTSPIFAMAFSASVAVAGFFLLSTTTQQNILLKKVTQLVNLKKINHLVKRFTKQPQIPVANVSPLIKKNTVTASENLTRKPTSVNTASNFSTFFHTDPAGAQIFINDKPINISPNDIKLPTNKIVKITVTKYKYRTEEFKINTNLLLQGNRKPTSINPRVVVNKQEIKVVLKKLKKADDIVK